MKFSSTGVSLILAPGAVHAARALECNNIVAGDPKYTFDLEKLGGPHSVVVSEARGPSLHNVTYTLDICQPLKRPDEVPDSERCPDGTMVCAIKRLIHGDTDTFDYAYPIAGDLTDYDGKALDPLFSILENEADDKTDSAVKGVRIVMNGGLDMGSERSRSQRAMVDFLCDKDLEGTEGEYKPEDEYLPKESQQRRDAEKPEPPKQIQLGDDPENAALQFESYDRSAEDPNADVLHLTWRTKYACQKRSDDGGDGDDEKPGDGDGDKGGDDEGDDKKSGGGMGWFAILLIIILVVGAAYLIFGSWLNYTRYGARGWDLVPHGDTIREIPWMLKDWTRRGLNTVQGSGSRGGYSAV